MFGATRYSGDLVKGIPCILRFEGGSKKLESSWSTGSECLRQSSNFSAGEASCDRGSSNECDDEVMKILCLLFLQRMRIMIRIW